MNRFYFIFNLFILSCAVLLTITGTAVAAMQPDLKLKETVAQKLFVSPKPNPHELIQCTDCHETKPLENPKINRETSLFLSEDFTDDLCVKCHKGKCEHHPTDIYTEDAGGGGSIADVFPQRYILEGRYKMVCMTCHDIHYPHTGFNLLRGYSINPRSFPSRFNTRLDFCKGCHGEKIDFFSPHKRDNDTDACTFCHTEKPDDGTVRPLKSNINFICSYCHQVYPEPHYLHFNPFPDLENSEIRASGVRLVDGKYTCITCHLAHGSSGQPSYLRKEYVTLARDSSRINPHKTSTFCLNCHPDTPMKTGEPMAELLVEDVSNLCNKCHGTGMISGMYHPLSPLREGMEPPEELPLDNEGRITCTTCHENGHAPVNPENPKFIRGGPYPAIMDLCRKCHDRQSLAGRNPHLENQQDKGCDICHHSGTVYEREGMKVGPAKADSNLLCLRCHEFYPHPASHHHNVRPGDYAYVAIDRENLPLDGFGRITCYTCHQVHQMKPTDKFLRLPSSQAFISSICTGCHPY